MQPVYCISDMHLNPGDKFFHMVANLDGRLVLNGDILNILPVGKEAWWTLAGKYTILSIVDSLPPSGCDYIVGNHEGRKTWVKDLFKDFPQVKVSSSLELYDNQHTYHFEHGHKFTEWRILSIGADEVVQFMTGWNPILRQWWYNFCVGRDWLPSRYMNPKPANLAAQVVGLYWGAVIMKAMRSGKSYIVGHSHVKPHFLFQFEEFGIKVVDTGSKELVQIV